MAAKKPAPKSAKKAAPKMCPDCGKPIVDGKCACDTGMAKSKLPVKKAKGRPK